MRVSLLFQCPILRSAAALSQSVSALSFRALPRFRRAFLHCPSERCRAFAERFRTVLQSAAALSQSVSALSFRALSRFRRAFPHCSSITLSCVESPLRRISFASHTSKKKVEEDPWLNETDVAVAHCRAIAALSYAAAVLLLLCCALPLRCHNIAAASLYAAAPLRAAAALLLRCRHAVTAALPPRCYCAAAVALPPPPLLRCRQISAALLLRCRCAAAAALPLRCCCCAAAAPLCRKLTWKLTENT